MKSFLIISPGLYIIFALSSCTPKTPQKVDLTPPQETTQTDSIKGKETPCLIFTDLHFVEQDEAENNYVIYRDMLRRKEVIQAMSFWRKIYNKVPAADGQRSTVFIDGIYFYEYLISQETDSIKKNQYVDTIFTIYDQLKKCYPKGSYSQARKGFDLFYKYPHLSSQEETFMIFKTTIDEDLEMIPYFIINPFASLLVELHSQKKINNLEAKKYVKILNNRLSNLVNNCKGRECETYEPIQDYLPQRFAYFETVNGFYDCNYFYEKYYTQYLEDPEDCDNILEVLSKLRFGGCEAATNIEYANLISVYDTRCRVVVKNPCYQKLEETDYHGAVECFKERINTSDDPNQKGQNALVISKIYFSHLRDFPKARKYALDAAKFRTNWGEPYLLLGRLYASSGPLCGSGRGWNSQVVVWVAIDMWNKAKQVDPSTADKANKNINRYAQYMPDKEAIFSHLLKEGDTFKVPCWIQRNTKVRSSP